MPIGNQFLPAMKTAARGLEAQRRKLGAATENLANASTSRTEDGDPFRIKRAVQEVDDANYARLNRSGLNPQTELRSTDARHLPGGALPPGRGPEHLGPETNIEEVEKERLEYDPSHPHADEEGYVHYPDVNVAQEMARMTSANRVYEANLSAVEATKSMAQRTFEI
ncbi:MAG: flagellar basal body rod C-terminal domain-containing protein [Salinibacter sp.]|jgi:flagellar basal-body rod protein FlgC|uniref:flagellar basal body rod protein FlgC n=1 Tax=Salinibacter sp. TaxID=2065818 RepID=UPI002FC3BFF6